MSDQNLILLIKVIMWGIMLVPIIMLVGAIRTFFRHKKTMKLTDRYSQLIREIPDVNTQQRWGEMYKKCEQFLVDASKEDQYWYYRGTLSQFLQMKQKQLTK